MVPDREDLTAGAGAPPAPAPMSPDQERWPLLFLPLSVLLLAYHHADAFNDPFWVPVHDTLTQYTEFLYALAALVNGELPLWNSYWHGGQPFYLLLNHGLLLNPLHWVWMEIGMMLGLTPPQIYLCAQVSGIVLFALGGYYLARSLTRSVAAGAGAFIILLFSGNACYWMTQVYSLHVIMYVPWVLLVILRYAVRPSPGRALSAAVILGIAMNTYYPPYLFTFVITLGMLLVIFYRRRLMRLPYRTYAVHALAAVPLLVVLLLPTYLIYHEITTDYYQIGRDAGPGQPAPDTDAFAFDGDRIADSFVTLVPSMVRATRYYHADGVPLVGAGALALALYEAISFRRRGRFWLFALLLMVLHLLGTATPFHVISQAIIPFYRIIGASAFFLGFLVFCVTLLASLGIERLLRFLRDGSRRLRQRTVRVATGAVLAVLLATGSSQLGTILEGPLHTVQNPMFSSTSRFNFSIERPDFYTTAQPLGPQFEGECCINFYHLAERFDAPYWFDRWQSQHTLFIPRNLYRAGNFAPRYEQMEWKAEAPGFEELLTGKFHWFSRYTVTDAPIDIAVHLARGVLPLENDRQVRDRGRRIEAASVPSLPTEPSREPALFTISGKTANTACFDVDVREPLFLLYTDLYHAGFRAFVDGREQPILKGMGLFKALELERGRHSVSFVFAPRYRYVLIFYLLVSVPALLLLVTVAVRNILRARKE